jgi:uncharacterized protein (DUF305 family)
MTFLTKATLALVLMAGVAHAETATTGHDMMMMAVPEGATEATRGFVEAMNKMSMAMSAEFTGNADRDFIVGMIPHHQGALDAARVVLAHGTDPDVRSFAEAVIAAQEKEILWMQDWLARHPE